MLNRFRLVILILAAPSVAFANVGVPMIFLGIPFLILTLIPVVAIESWIYSKGLNRSFKSNLKETTIANLLTTFIGYPCAWILQFLVMVCTMYVIPLFGFKSEDVIGPLARGFGVILSAAWLIPMEREFWWMVPVAGMVGLVPAYWISIKIEGAYLARRWKITKAELCPSVRQAHRASYSLLLGILALLLIRNYFWTGRDQISIPGAFIRESAEQMSVTISNESNFDEAVRRLSDVEKPVRLSIRRASLNDQTLGKLHYIRNLISLELSGDKITDEVLRSLPPLNKLVALSLRDVEITGSGLESVSNYPLLDDVDISSRKFEDRNLVYLSKVRHLSNLKITKSRIDGTGFKSFAGHQNLERLSVADSSLSPQGAAAIGRIPNLKYLGAYDTTLDDEGLKGLSGLSKLEFLDIWATKVTDAGMEHVGKLHSLKSLSLPRLPISDAGLVGLRNLENLEVIDLSNTKVSDSGIMFLRNLKKLQRLWVNDTSVSESGEAEFKKYVPAVEVFRR